MALQPYTDRVDEGRIIVEHHGTIDGSCSLKHKTSAFKPRRVFLDSRRDTKSVYGRCPLCKSTWVRLGLP